MCKLVSGAEFDVAKRTIVSTKLAEEDSLIFVGSADEMEQVVFQSEGGYFLRFQKQDISAMKKTSIGVRGMKLAEETTGSCISSGKPPGIYHYLP